MLRKRTLNVVIGVAVSSVLTIGATAAAAPPSPAPSPSPAPAVSPTPTPTPPAWTWTWPWDKPAASPSSTPSGKASPSPSGSPSPTGSPSPRPEMPKPPADAGFLSSMFRAFAKMAGAMAPVAEIGGQILGGERDEKKLLQAQKAADQGLDNLLAIIPTKAMSKELSPGQAQSLRKNLKTTAEMLKADVRQMIQAAVKFDPAKVVFVGATMASHLVMLAFDVFAGFGVEFVQGFFKNFFKFPGVPPKPPAAK